MEKPDWIKRVHTRSDKTKMSGLLHLFIEMNVSIKGEKTGIFLYEKNPISGF